MNLFSSVKNNNAIIGCNKYYKREFVRTRAERCYEPKRLQVLAERNMRNYNNPINGNLF